MDIVNEIPATELRKEDSLLNDHEVNLVNSLFNAIQEKKDKVITNSDRNITFKFASVHINIKKISRYFEDLGYVVKVGKVRPGTIENIHQINISWADLGWRDIDSKFQDRG